MKNTTLHLLHNLDETIICLFEPYLSEFFILIPNRKLRIPGYPHMTQSTKSYASILIDLTRVNQHETPLQANKLKSTKRYHSGQEKTLSHTLNIPQNMEAVTSHNNQLVTAVSDTTRRLKILKSKHADTYQSISTLSSRIES